MRARVLSSRAISALRRHMRGSVALVSVGVALTLSGCFFASAITRNFAQLGLPQRRVAHRITQPIREDARLAVLWVGHATVLVQIDDARVLTDPVFTSAVGQLSPRLVEPGIDVEDVPSLDAVLISHVHFDHLSVGSLDLLETRIRQLLVPEGALVYAPRADYPARELRWWDHWVAPNGMRVTAVPVDHVGGRYGLDKSWQPRAFGGYVIEHHGITVYFGGDTAYDAEKFRAVRARYPHIDLAILPIAPIEPRDFMAHTHVDPDEAVRAFADLGAEQMLPIHYDTFVNSTDEVGDAPRRLREVMARDGLSENRVVILGIGEQRVLIERDRADP